MTNRLAVKKNSFLLASLLATTILAAPVAGVLAEATNSGKVELSADQLSYNADTGEVRAIGRVLLESEGYRLEAGEVRYNEKTGRVEASGAVMLQTPQGDKIYSPRIELSNELKHAFVEDISLLMKDGAQVRALEGETDDEAGLTTLKRAVYSPCKVCNDGSDKTPLWQIKAVKVVHNRGKKRLYYKNASLEILGVPILWTPYFSHPDPSVDRASGILPLEIQTNKNLGVVIGLPYHHVFNQSQDATLKPIFTTREGMVLAAEYRHHLGYGQYIVDGSITRTDERDDNNNLTGENEYRGHISSSGRFQHSESWRSTYQLNWTSDDTYLRRYDFSNDDTLISNYNLERFGDNTYLSARTVVFQGLRQEDIAGESAFALPLIDAEYIPDYEFLGGTSIFRANGLALHRTDGLDTQKVTASARWTRRFIMPKGFVLDLDALVRSDFYNVHDADQPDDMSFAASFDGVGGTEWRNVARLDSKLSWPLVKFTENASHTLEPILQVTLSPHTGTPENIFNEDSRSFELSDLNLFSADRTAGYDLWEAGSRVTYGVRWFYEASVWTADVLFGQSFRISGDNSIFAQGTGLERDFSDLTGHTIITYSDWLDIEHRYRVDENSLAVRRNEINITAQNSKVGLTAGYLKLDRNMIITGREDREEVRTKAFYNINKNWKLTGAFIHRLKGAVRQTVIEDTGGVKYDIGLSYENECLELGVKWRESFTEDRDIEPGTSILFRLKLKNLG